MPRPRLLLALGIPLALACARDPANEPAPSMHAPPGYEKALLARGITPTRVAAADAPNTPFTVPTLTAAQAARGEAVYRSTCARCHALAQHTGDAFATRWANRRLSDLHLLLMNTMPQDAPGSLTEQQYIDVVAYLLSRNGFAPGAVELRADTSVLRHARIATAAPPAPKS